MIYTEDFTLPAKEELTVEEINLSTPALRAGAFHLGKYCEKPSQVCLVVDKLVATILAKLVGTTKIIGKIVLNVANY